MEELSALDKSPVRSTMLPYGRQTLDEDHRKAVEDVLRGPMGAGFGQSIGKRLRSRRLGLPLW